MKYLFLLSILIIQTSCEQTCSCDSLFNRFKNDIQIELSRNNNRIVWDDETKISFYRLMIDCPNKCLAKYVEDTIPIIRVLIFGGLADKNIENGFLEEILLKHNNDTAENSFRSGCMDYSWTVKEEMQSVLKWKDKRNNSNEFVNFETRLENLQNDLKGRIRFNIPGVHHRLISKEELLLVDSLKCQLDGYKVISFNLFIDNEAIAVKNIFTNEIRNSIREMLSGDLLYFEDINMEFPDKTIRKIPSFVLEIK